MLENYGLTLSESLEYMRLYGIKAYGEKKEQGFLYGKDAILVYESFEKIIESVLQKTESSNGSAGYERCSFNKNRTLTG